MKIQLDTINKTIKIEEQVNLKELVKTLEKLLPKGLWKEFDLINNERPSSDDGLRADGVSGVYNLDLPEKSLTDDEAEEILKNETTEDDYQFTEKGFEPKFMSK